MAPPSTHPAPLMSSPPKSSLCAPLSGGGYELHSRALVASVPVRQVMPKDDDEIVLSLTEVGLATRSLQKETWSEGFTESSGGLKVADHDKFESEMSCALKETRAEGSVYSANGEVQERYQLLAELGRGAAGVVWKAVHRESGTSRAIKSVTAKTAKQAQDLELELNIARLVKHKNIVRLQEVVHDNGTLHLVMELCTGGTLAQFIRKQLVKGIGTYVYAMTLHVFGHYAYQMISGLAYLHFHRITHRDIKAENYVLESQEPMADVKLTDFGMACRFTSGNLMTRTCGSIYTMAPEVVSSSYTELADVWSLGVTLHLLGCGHLPYVAKSYAEASQIFFDDPFAIDPQPWKGREPEMLSLVKQMLVIDPSNRPSAWDILRGTKWLRQYAELDNACCCSIQ